MVAEVGIREILSPAVQDEPGMQIRLGGQQADPVLLAARQLLQPRDNLPHIRASGQCCATVMGRSPKMIPG
jgi:hypothetical protein